MINGKDKPDNNLKNLIKKAGMESPSSGFTDQVMNQIMGDQQPASALTNKTFGIKNYVFLSAAGLAAIMYAIYYLVSHDISLLPGSYDPALIPVFGKLFDSLKTLFQSVQISSFTIVIILAVAGLFIIDRLLRKFQAGKQSYFSF